MKCYKLLYDYENDRNYIDCDKAYIGKLNEHCMNKGIRVNVNSDIYFEYDSIILSQSAVLYKVPDCTGIC